MIFLNGEKIVPTIFPDGTSQVWKLKEVPDTGEIVWFFESEAELMHVAQASLLVKGKCHLHMPYLPYARQDKKISNEETFALRPFCALVNRMKFEKVTALDVHNTEVMNSILSNFENIEPLGFHKAVLEKVKPDFIIFPDAGARRRYDHLSEMGHVVFAKKREQETGKIIGLEIEYDTIERKLDGKTAVIVDDICDGGATFIGIAKEISKQGVNVKLHLMVTHGIFSKGRKVLEDAGITLHTTNSLLRNADAFPI